MVSESYEASSAHGFICSSKNFSRRCSVPVFIMVWLSCNIFHLWVGTRVGASTRISSNYCSLALNSAFSCQMTGSSWTEVQSPITSSNSLLKTSTAVVIIVVDSYTTVTHCTHTSGGISSSKFIYRSMILCPSSIKTVDIFEQYAFSVATKLSNFTVGARMEGTMSLGKSLHN